VEQAAAEILASAGAENWVVTRIEEQTLATFHQARRGRPTQDMPYVKKESTRFELTYHTDPARMAEDARRVLDLFEPVQRHTLQQGRGPTEVMVTDLTPVQRRLLKLLNLPAKHYGH